MPTFLPTIICDSPPPENSNCNISNLYLLHRISPLVDHLRFFPLSPLPRISPWSVLCQPDPPPTRASLILSTQSYIECGLNINLVHQRAERLSQFSPFARPHLPNWAYWSTVDVLLFQSYYWIVSDFVIPLMVIRFHSRVNILSVRNATLVSKTSTIVPIPAGSNNENVKQGIPGSTLLDHSCV